MYSWVGEGRGGGGGKEDGPIPSDLYGNPPPLILCPF